MDPSSKSQDEYCTIQPCTLSAFYNVDKQAADGSLRVEPVYKRPLPSSNQTIVLQVTCNKS